MSDIVFQALPHEQAAELIKGKPAVTRKVFDRLLPEARARAFTVGGIEDANTLQSLRDAIAELPRGAAWEDVKEQVIEGLTPWLGDAAEKRAELLLRMHGFQAYQAARHEVMVSEEGRAAHGYWMYLTMGDENVRDSHAALNGLILPAEHPFWRDHYPPWDYNCRCQVVPVSDEDYAEAQAAGRVAGQPGANEPAARARGFVLSPAMERRLLDQGTLDLGAGHPVDVRSPKARAQSEKERRGAFGWHPGDLRIDLETLRERYDPEVFGEFEKFAREQDVGEGISLFDWLEGQSLSEAPFRAFQSDKYLAGWADKNLEPITRKLPAEQKAAGVVYQQEGSRLNELLRLPHRGRIDANAAKTIAELDKTLARSRLPESVVLWRRTDLPAGIDLRPGGVYRDKGYASTSLSKNLSAGVKGNTFFEIRAPRGTRGMWIGDLDKAHGFEREVLLPRKAGLKILAVEERDGYRYVRAEVLR